MKLLLYCVFVHLGIYTSLYASATGRGLLFGLGPKVYRNGDEVKLFVHELSSVQAQVPLKYYDLPFCPFGGKSTPKEYYGGLGQMLEGSLTQESSYELSVQNNAYSEILCRRHGSLSLNAEQVQTFLNVIQMGYMVHMSVGSLPMITKKSYKMTEGQEGLKELSVKDLYTQGFPLGYTDEQNVYINNHISIEVHIHPLAAALRNMKYGSLHGPSGPGSL